MYGKVIGAKEMMTWEDEIPICFCHMEELFLPVFFDMMAHLIIHLVTEVRIGGQVHYRSACSTERFIGNLKNMVHTKS
jgi:hypothetical protein